MRRFIHSDRYDFCVVANVREFYIQATDKASLRHSCINNLNPILSELVHEQYNDAKFGDSRWIVSKEEGQELAQTSVEFLSNEKFRRYIESKLDEDRMLGEWENIKRKKGRVDKHRKRLDS